MKDILPNIVAQNPEMVNNHSSLSETMKISKVTERVGSTQKI